MYKFLNLKLCMYNKKLYGILIFKWIIGDSICVVEIEWVEYCVCDELNGYMWMWG